jgi:hypothetical protein
VFAALEVLGEPSSRELTNKSNGNMKAVSMIFNILFYSVLRFIGYVPRRAAILLTTMPEK